MPLYIQFKDNFVYHPIPQKCRYRTSGEVESNQFYFPVLSIKKEKRKREVKVGRVIEFSKLV